MTALLLAVLLSFAATAAGVAAVRRYSLARSVMDVPNERSLHTVPTPRGGGVAIALCALAGCGAAAALGLLPGRFALGFVGGGALVALAGWLDDHGGLRARTRFVLHLAGAAWLVGGLGGFPWMQTGTGRVYLGAAGAVIAVLGVVWLVNLYNFMDGIDGLAGSEAVAAGAAVALVLGASGAGGLSLLAAVVAASSAGFLVWNWQPARIFMGDVGSGFLGFAFGALVLAGERHASVPVLALLLPLGVFIADATLTLARRLARGERVYQAHRTHAYQRLVQAGWSHRAVTLAVTALNVLLGAAAYVAWSAPRLLPAMVAVSVAVVVAAGYLALRITLRRAAPAPA